MALLNEINVKGVSHPIVTDDGYYQEMTVGDAEQLVATTFTEDDAPYNFRTAGGAIDIGDRKQVEGIVGGTIAWNQLVPTNQRSYTNPSTESTSAVSFFFRQNSSPWTRFYQKYITVAGQLAFIAKATVTGKAQMIHNGNSAQFQFANNVDVIANHCYLGMINFTSLDASVVGGVVANDIQLFDLTQMFGSAIADYIYSLEQANAGAGVAWFKKYFPKPYYTYNAGELMSVKALRHITRGFNAFDKSTMLLYGYISDETGEVDQTDPSSGYRCTDFIKVVPNQTYYIKSEQTNGMWGAWYDADKNFISGITSFANTVKTAPKEAYYARLTIKTSQSGNPDTFCINLSWDGERDGEYEEYSEHVYELDPDLELRGIPKLSAGNDLYYDGDVYEPDGTVTRKYGIVDLGTLDWQTSTEGVFYASGASLAYKRNLSSVAMCTKYAFGGTGNSSSTVVTKPDKTYYLNLISSGSAWVFIHDTAYTDAASFKTAMSGVYLVYELAESTEESADPYNGTQIVDDFGTEEFVDAGVTAGTRDVAIPVGHNSLYQPNLRAKLEMAPESPEDDGYYVVYHHNGINEYVPLIIPQELPELPTEDGTYTLKCTVASGSATLSFESEV